jgi:O-antigen/teichoic acid export membrane protein
MWGRTQNTVASLARNVATRYLIIGADTIVGLLLMPFNLAYLGQAAWGLWLLTASLNTYFTVLDLGYGGSITRFVAQYRAKEDARAINEIASTLFVLFTGIGTVIYLAYVVVAFNVQHVFTLTPDQVETARMLMFIMGTQVAMGVPFGVFGGVMNGFQRYDINNLVSVATIITVALVNVAVLAAGYGLIEVAAATTAVRLISNLVYARNAYMVFPLLSVRPSFFRRERLKEVTGYSVYSAMAGWAYRLNYMSDSIIIGFFMGPAAVALFAVPRRVSQAVRSLTNQFNSVLLPVVVESQTRRQADRLRTILIHGTKLSLLAAIPLSAALFLLADPLIPLYVGNEFAASVPIAQILAVLIAFRVGNATSQVVLKGVHGYQMYAYTQLGVAVVNVALSVWWIQWYGLIGQAMGTLVPVAVASAFIMWPAACRQAHVPLGQAFRRAVWPTLWPLPAAAVPILLMKPLMPPTIVSVLICGVVGTACYAIVAFAFAMDAQERSMYVGKLRQIVRFWRVSSEAGPGVKTAAAETT